MRDIRAGSENMTDWKRIRDTLFADAPLDDLLAIAGTSGEPWQSFGNARDLSKRGETVEARRVLRGVVSRSDLEPRLTLQAWHALRSLGEAPPADVAQQLLGVVVEVGMDGGLDLLAGYADCTARYYNYSGRAVIWERPNASLDVLVKQMLDAARAILPNIGLWEEARRPPPERNIVRLNMLTPAGLSFGEGPFEVLANDPMGAPLITAATALMQALTKLTKEPTRVD